VSKAATHAEELGPPRGVIGQRSTRQRAAVAGVLRDVDDFRSAQNLHEMLIARGERVGLTTVYRSLQAMAEVGEIDVLIGGDGQSLYRRCGQRSGHHHHLVCRECGLTVEVHGSAVERWTRSIAERNGFSDVSHTLDIFGLCRDCTLRAPRRQP
jgi:Fur family ferric uptake transcriptional regulator